MRDHEVTEILLSEPQSFIEIKFKLEPNEEYENELKVYLLLDLLSTGMNERATLMGEVFSYRFYRDKVLFTSNISSTANSGVISELFRGKTPDFEEFFNIIILGNPNLVTKEGEIREEIERQYREEILKKESNIPFIRFGVDGFESSYFSLEEKKSTILYTEVESKKRYMEYRDSKGDFAFFYSERTLPNGELSIDSTVEEYKDEIVSLLMERDVTKLKNGFVLDSVFYETEEEVLEVLRSQLK